VEMVVVMAYNSLVFVDCFFIVGDSFLEKYVIGWWCCLRIAPIPLPVALVLTMKIY